MSNTSSKPSAPTPAAGPPGRRGRSAQRRRGDPRARVGVPERRAGQRAHPPADQRERDAARDEDRRRAGRPADGRSLEAPRLQRTGRAGAGRAGAPDRDRPRGPAREVSRSTGPTRPTISNRGRIFAQELMKYGRHEKAEKVLSKIVAGGGDGEDWLGLGVAQLAQKKLDKAESTLRGRAEPPQGLAVPEPAAREGDEGEGRPQGRAREHRARHPDRQQLGRRVGVPGQRDQGGDQRGRDGQAGRGAGERPGQREVRRRRTSPCRASTRRTRRTRRRATGRSASRRRRSSARRAIRSRCSACRRSTGRAARSTRSSSSSRPTKR